MSMGIGKRYFVHVIKNCFGTLDECMAFMESLKPLDKEHWFELRPIVTIFKGKVTEIKEYQCMLLEDGSK